MAPGRAGTSACLPGALPARAMKKGLRGKTLQVLARGGVSWECDLGHQPQGSSRYPSSKAQGLAAREETRRALSALESGQLLCVVNSSLLFEKCYLEGGEDGESWETHIKARHGEPWRAEWSAPREGRWMSAGAQEACGWGSRSSAPRPHLRLVLSPTLTLS